MQTMVAILIPADETIAQPAMVPGVAWHRLRL
jgi:hypothetical protein